MTDQNSMFELRIATLFESYADSAPIGVDARGLARTIAAQQRQVIVVLGRTFIRPRWLTPLVLMALLLAALAAAAFVGAQLLRQEPDGILQLPPPRAYVGVLRAIAPGKLEPTGALGLRDGRVFAQSNPSGGRSLYEVLDPDSGVVRDLGDANAERWGAAMVELQDGRVLVVGSDYGPIDGGTAPTVPTTAEIVDPDTGLTTLAGPMIEARFLPIAVALRDGRVLVAGGLVPPRDDVDVALSSAEIYDPATNAFTAIAPMSVARVRPVVLPLADGRIYLVNDTWWSAVPNLGGDIFDPQTDSFTRTSGAGDVLFPNGTALADGRAMLVTGHCDEVHVMEPDGTSDTAKPVSVVIFDPRGGQTTDAPEIPHCIANLVALSDGRAFVSGFYYTAGDALTTWSGLYDPEEGVVQLTQGPRGYRPFATALSDGRVFVWPGGIGWGDELGDFNPAWADIFE